jgi:hypothetical protein
MHDPGAAVKMKVPLYTAQFLGVEPTQPAKPDGGQPIDPLENPDIVSRNIAEESNVQGKHVTPVGQQHGCPPIVAP